MVLAELGGKIANAIANMRNSTVLDEAVIDEMLKEIGNALMASDVQFQLVVKLRKNIKAAIGLNTLAEGMNKRKLIQKAVFDELCNLLDPKTKPYTLKKGHNNVVMFVGLQGAGKTTTISKLAHHYKRKGWNPCLVCADTYRAGAFDQLKQNASKIKVPFYGSYTETNAAKVAGEGVEIFKKEGYDLILVDTSGRHKQEAALFEEMEQINEAVKPDWTIFVMDGSIGQAAFDQATAFKKVVSVGSVIVTKLDGHARGGGALSAVAATESPVIFIGTGEHFDDLDSFEVKSFVSRLLGYGDVPGMVKAITEAMPLEKANELNERIQQGKFTLRDMYEQLQNIMNMGPLEKVMEMMPGMNQILPQLNLKGRDGSKKLRIMVNILDSMTDDELDADKPMKDVSRLTRIARGAGRSLKEVMELLDQHKLFAKMVDKMKGFTKGGKLPNNKMDLSKMANMVPPQLLKQMGGMGAISNLMKQMGDMGNLNIPGFGGPAPKPKKK